MSVQTTNTLSTVVLSTAIESGAVAWAASALASPIGALGGAIFGAVRYVSQIPLALIGAKYLNASHPNASTDAKTLATALKFFGSYAAAWGVLAALGFSLTLSHVVSLTIMSIFTAICISLIADCLGLNATATVIAR